MRRLAIITLAMLIGLCAFNIEGKVKKTQQRAIVPLNNSNKGYIANDAQPKQDPKPERVEGPAVMVGQAADGEILIISIGETAFLMQKVAGGSFIMGATSEQGSANPIERPAHEVELSSFYIGETEVTQETWIAVMGSNPSFFGSDMRNPVNNITWDDSQRFVNRLNALLAKNDDNKGMRFSLPTEAQWEYAARGGQQSQGYRFSGSNYESSVAWNSSNSEGTVHQVKSKLPNELGLYDMNGNVWEWCQDLWNPNFYSSSPRRNPVCTSTTQKFSTFHIARGNGIKDAPGRYVAWRNAYPITSKGSDIGMRLVLNFDEN